MAGKKKTGPAASALVAASPILIEGKHFDAGAPITGVSEDEVRKAVSIGRVVKAGEVAAAPEPEPETASEGEPEAEG